MSDHRILLIENPARLSVHLGRLCISREGYEDVHVLPKDIAVLCLHHHTIQMSVHVLRVLAEAGASVIVTDAKHHPCASIYPWANHGDSVRRLRYQMALDASPRRALVWQEIVQARLRTQAANLRHFGRKGGLRLERLAKAVLPDDANKCEGIGARHYWRCLLPAGFQRAKQGAEDPLNARLNYGYAVLRSMVARALVQAGLHPALGLGHRNMENPFNLADDFIEPYRFVVERHVIEQEDFGEFDGTARKRILGFVEFPVRMGKATYRLPAAVTETVASYVRLLERPGERLALPENVAPLDRGEERWA